MQVLAALTIGLVVWLVAWSFGIKSFDAFLVPVALVVGAASARIVTPFIKQQLGR